MKSSIVNHATVLGLLTAIAVTGCRHRHATITPIPAIESNVSGGGTPTAPISPGVGNAPAVAGGPQTQELPGATSEGIPAAGLAEFEGMLKNPAPLKNDTIHFDFDRSAIKPNDEGKLQDVASYLKGHSQDKLLVEGNCDERGTEEYNRALGERRAQSAREYLVNLGIGADRIRTISYGEDHPVDPAHNAAAWAKNRRDDFVVLIPKPNQGGGGQ